MAEEKDLNLKEVVKERHPFFYAYGREINQILNGYNGNNMTNLLHQHKKESDAIFFDRKRRTVRVNYLKFFTDLNFRGIFSNNEKNIREFETGSKLDDLLMNIDRKGNDIDQVMKRAAKLAYLGRQSYVLIDNSTIDEFELDYIDEPRPYIQTLSFLDVVNWSVDRAGYYNWVLIKYVERLDQNPYIKAKDEDRYVLYTREYAIICDKEGNVLKKTPNTLGVIPLVPIRAQDINDDGIGEGIAKEIFDLDIENMNLRSLYNAELYKILFNMLAIQGLEYDDRDKVPISEATIVRVAKDVKNMPKWLAPEITTLQEKRQRMLENITEMIRIAGFKGKESVTERAAQTGISKLFDFLSTSETLLSIVKKLELAEKQIWYYCWLFLHGNEVHSQSLFNSFCKKNNISYSKSFNIINLDKEIENLFILDGKNYSPFISGEARKVILQKLISDDVSYDTTIKMRRNIDEWVKEEQKKIDMNKDKLLGFRNRGFETEEFLKDENEYNYENSEKMNNLNKKLSEASQENLLSKNKKISRNISISGGKNR